jgi:hypothetical protein
MTSAILESSNNNKILIFDKFNPSITFPFPLISNISRIVTILVYVDFSVDLTWIGFEGLHHRDFNDRQVDDLVLDGNVVFLAVLWFIVRDS